MAIPVKYIMTCICTKGSTTRLRHVLKLMGAEEVHVREEQLDPAKPRPRSDCKPTAPDAIRIAALFLRSPDKEWSDAEKSLFLKARSRKVFTEENLAALERYYHAERAKGDEGRQRRDLKTFLNNVDGEIDRAMTVKPSNGQALQWTPSNVVKLPPQSEEEQERLRQEAKQLAAQFRKEHGR